MYQCPGRITAFLDSVNKTVKLVFWSPQANDPTDIETIKNHYVGLSFTKQRVLYNFKNTDHGITVTFDPVKKKVVQVLREDPNLPITLTLNSNKKYPVVTICQ